MTNGSEKRVTSCTVETQASDVIKRNTCQNCKQTRIIYSKDKCYDCHHDELTNSAVNVTIEKEINGNPAAFVIDQNEVIVLDSDSE